MTRPALNFRDIKDRPMRYRHPLLAVLIGVLAGSPGCGGPGNGVWVTGKLLKGGAKYTPPEDQVVSVTFVPLEVQDASGKTTKGGDIYAAEFNDSESTFEVPGPDRRGIPPGKYRVAVTQKLKREAYDAARQKAPRGKKPPSREADMLADRFGTSTSPLIVQVNRSEEVTVDMDRPTESPKP
jgi:hypothetical protein